MTKELLTIEFRYHDKPKNEDFSGSETKTITIGVFDTLDEAIIEGNKALEIFEKHFKLNTAWNRKDRFSKNGGCFGSANRLISPLAYLQTPFDFYAKITKLTYTDIEQTILDILDATNRYKEYKLAEKK
ncbi:MAG: hypothetical protein AABY22_12085 [Nanoarchaeota archaeon]